MRVSRSTLAKRQMRNEGPPNHRCGPRIVYYVKDEIDAWQMIESGEYASIAELANAEKVNQSYACRMLRLTLQQLAKPLPVRWDEQFGGAQDQQ